MLSPYLTFCVQLLQVVFVFYLKFASLMTMFEYCQLILQKVSFDISLFRLEWQKACNKLSERDIAALKKWCIDTFGIPFCANVDPFLVS